MYETVEDRELREGMARIKFSKQMLEDVVEKEEGW